MGQELKRDGNTQKEKGEIEGKEEMKKKNDIKTHRRDVNGKKVEQEVHIESEVQMGKRREETKAHKGLKKESEGRREHKRTKRRDQDRKSSNTHIKTH